MIIARPIGVEATLQLFVGRVLRGAEALLAGQLGGLVFHRLRELHGALGDRLEADGAREGLDTRKWTDQASVERYTTEVVVPRFGGALVLLDRQQTGPGSPSSPDDYGTTRTAGGTAPAAKRDPLDDDVPF